jgi:hypothetical protein
MPEQKYVELEGSALISHERRMEMRRQLFAAYGVSFPAAIERNAARRLAFADLSVGRLLAGLAAGGLTTSVLWIDSALLDTYTFPYWPILAVLSGSELLWMVAGAASILTLCWSRGFLRGRDCLIVGAALACFVPYVVVQIAWMIAPLTAAFRHTHGHIHSFNRTDIGFAAYAAAGLLTAPIGALGGWILWRVLSPYRDQDEHLEAPARFKNFFTVRVVLGLFLAALPPGLVFAVFLPAAKSPAPLPHAAVLFAWAASTGLVALLAGALILILFRKRPPIGRAQCLWLGTGIGMLLPLATFCAGSIVGHLAKVSLDIADKGNAIAVVAGLLFIGYFLTPFGLAGGWLLWRIAFRNRQPAPLPLSAIFE